MRDWKKHIAFALLTSSVISSKLWSAGSTLTTTRYTALQMMEDSEQKSANRSCNEKERPVCGRSRHSPVRISLRHIEANGIGYNQGYSTFEGFLAPPNPWSEKYVPFLDLRGHVFNNGKLAANAGIGMRGLMGHWVWGVNAFYDYRDTKHQHYNQIALGLECLGTVWDFRVNGYLPVGDKRSSLFGLKFAGFRGNSLLTSHRYEFAMKGINAEAGAHVNTWKCAPLYFAAGPYYLEGRGRVAWGGQLRAVVDLWNDYIRIEGNTSYDSVFHWIGQGQVGINIPLGYRRRVKQRCGYTCRQERLLADRLLQRVDRFEIIPVKKKRVIKDPPDFTFYFVDNTSHSLGIFESPFNTLTAAFQAAGPNAIIIVSPGDGTSRGLDQGYTLRPGQKLIGDNIPFTVMTSRGTVTIPARHSTLPLIKNVPGGVPVVQVVANNEVAGLHLVGSEIQVTDAVLDITGANAFIHNNIIETNNNNNGLDIDTGNCGTTIIVNNSFLCSDTSDTYGISVQASNGVLNISNNSFAGTSSASGFDVGVFFLPGKNTNVGGTLQATVANNLFNSQTNTASDSPAGINIENTVASQQLNMQILNNTINIPAGITNAEAGIFVQVSSITAGTNLTVGNNVSSTVSPVPGYLYVNSSPSRLTVTSFNNTGTQVGP